MRYSLKLVGAVLVLVLLAGCAQVSGTDGSPESSGLGDGGAMPGGGSQLGPDEYPDAPETLTEESVGAYVAAYEEEYRRIYILRHADVDVTDVGVSCTPASVTESDGVFEATVECGSWYEFQTGDSVGIADGAPYVAVYEVTADGIERDAERSTAP